MGAAGGNGGSDYTGFPDHAYRMELDGMMLLEVPVSILCVTPAWPMRQLRRLLGKSLKRKIWLRPNGRNLEDMLLVLSEAVGRRRDYVQFMLHSSELMPGGSPTFDSNRKVETLYAHLGQLFARARDDFDAATLSEYAERWLPSSALAPAAQCVRRFED